MNNKGFTLIELLITISVLAITLALAIPGFSSFISNTRLGAATNDIVTLVSFARAEAMRTGKHINVVATSSGNASNEWGRGVTVWFDRNDDGALSSDEVLREVVEFSGSSSVDVTVGPSDFSFNARGMTTAATTITVNFCDAREGEMGRRIDILSSGLVSVDSTSQCL